MSRIARRSVGLVLALSTGFAYAGCAAGSPDNVRARFTDSEAGANHDAGAAGDVNVPSGTGGGLAIGIDPNEAGAGGAGDAACAASVTKAERVPLDLYIMMDVSGSMGIDTGNGVTKWAAVKSALASFIRDDSSKGLGIGIQYFPLLKPNIPASCKADAECGLAAPCGLKFCLNALPTVNVCNVNADCNAGLFGGTPRCVPLSVCSADTTYACTAIGTPNDCLNEFGYPIGTCAAVTDIAELNKIGLGFCEHVDKCDAASYGTPAQDRHSVGLDRQPARVHRRSSARRRHTKRSRANRPNQACERTGDSTSRP